MLDAFKSNDRPLRVQRVRYYRVPRYPAHTDPDPTLAPEAVPYPWKGSVMAAVLALSEAGCSKSETEESSADAPSSKKPLPALEAKVQKQIDEIVDAVLREQPEGKKNPFAQKLGLSGLPYVSSPYALEHRNCPGFDRTHLQGGRLGGQPNDICRKGPNRQRRWL